MGEGLANTTKLGTTKKGIGPTYASKMNRTGVRLADLMDNFQDFTNKFSILADNYMASFPGLKVDKAAEIERYRELAERVRPMVVESNAAMLDIDFGTYPYVTSSNCSIGGVCTGL